MLVGGGGNSSGQTIAELVKRLGRKELNARQTWQVLRREVTIGALLALGLAIGTFLRVKLLSRDATILDAIAITISYMLIVIMANAVGVIAVMVLSRCGVERVGAPPVVQVVVDVLGITLTCMVSLAILGIDPAVEATDHA
uniref:SLC41A/MgtE integral membrane domain-containing protein n=1 Tax=Calcidiscus leptoporus TaxID=127549 RepID=A0A7S0NZ46_9EUKA|mmetsp:Transcript_42954/g.100658  ORF Transcript_42954/g.100658 Transcript_42954/m.100658 type:complete len:141 (+) Transcript_42954:301-723(+)